YAAWNRAIAEANGKYLTSANTDDRHVPTAYERMVSELEANPDVALVYADSAVTRVENAGIEAAPVEAYFRWPGFDPRHLFSVCYIGPQPMWRRSVHDRYGLFDEEMTVAGDYDFWLRMAGTEIFRHIPEVLGLYLAAASSIEHAGAGAGAAESEVARERNWPAEWGRRPPLCQGYLVPVEHDITVSLDDPARETPYVSIIMPTKDRLHLLGRALDSVIAQSYRNWELIVVNDGGESIRRMVEERDPAGRIRCIEFGWSRGQAAARNTALAEARGELVCYLDDDDCYLPDHLQTAVNEMAGEGDQFIYTDAVVVKETVADGCVQEAGRSNPYAHDDYSRERLLVNNYIPINTWVHRRSCLDQVGLFDDSLSCYEDWEFLLRLAERYGFRHVARTTVEVRHRIDQVDNVSRQRLNDTVQAYRDIYARHEQLLNEDLRVQREEMLAQLTESIDSWTAADGHTAPDFMAPGGDEKDRYAVWMKQHDLNDRDIARYCARMETEWTLRPSVHLVMTHVPGQEAALADTLDSLASQLYSGWGLSIVSGAPCPDPVFAEMGNLEWHQVDGALMDGVNEVVSASEAEWLGLLEAGTVLEPQWLYQHVDYLHRHPEWRLVYMDEDRVDEDGQRYDPLFKPDCNLELLRAMPYTGNSVLVEREALLAAGGWGRQTGAEVYDAVLRVIEHCGEQAVGHIPDVLLHRQDRFQLALDQELIAANRRASVAGHLERSGIEAEVMPGTLFGSCFVDYACADRPPVDIIVPVSGKPEMLELFLDNLLSQTQYPEFRVRLLAKDSIDIPAAVTAMAHVEVVRCSPSATRWQAVLELARGSQAEYLMLMSPGAIAIQSNWLERLVAQLGRPGVAVVAPRLVSSDQKVVGGGIVTGAGSYAVGMGAFGGLALDESGYMGRAQVAQELSAVSNSCMLVRKSVLTSIEEPASPFRLGFYQAVDFCLRVREAGEKIVWTPHSTLMFVGEDAPELDGLDLDELAASESGQMCGQSLPVLAADPAYSPNLALTGERFTVDSRFIPTWKPDDHSVGRVIGFGAGSIGSWKFRIEQPLEVLHREQRANSLVLPFNKELEQWPSMAELERLQPDALLMHNTMHDAYMDSMEAYKKINGAFIVFGQDDLMFALPPKNPFSKTGYKDSKKRLRRCLGIADRLVVTTAPLADELRCMADDIRVVPNYLDEAIWGSLTSQRATSDRPRVGWAGAQQHLGDLELLEEVVRETAQEVDWVFFGMCPEFLQPYVKEIHNPVTFGKYPQKLATLNLDLALAPLEHNRFNNSKSNLRILEYGALGWPVIATDIAPYREAPVCRVPNQPRAWIKAVRERIHDMDATRREGDVLRAWVRDNWMLQQHLQEWLAVLDPAGGQLVQQAGRHRAASL
ncbi:MAG TPA: glycosyltransferase, partial [Gammaproteobacteria bacterium]|nr:glycosyltransferase [Gammaproteobacteria bacterium]